MHTHTHAEECCVLTFCFMCVVFLPACMPVCTTWVQCPQNPQKEVEPNETEAIDFRDLPWVLANYTGSAKKKKKNGQCS